MKPQDRTRAILRSHLEPTMRLLLIAFCDYMNEHDSCFVSPETIQKVTGLALSTVHGHIKKAEQAGILIRTSGDHKAKDAIIDWNVLAACQPVAATRGGVRVKGQKLPIIGTGETTDNRYEDYQTSVRNIPIIGTKHTDNRTLSDYEATNKATIEADAPAKAKEQVFSAPQKLYLTWKEAHPTAAGTPTATNRKALIMILAECGTEAAAHVYLRWVAESQDERARQLRGAAPWHDGQKISRDDLVSLSRHIPTRLSSALAWDARGRNDPIPVKHQTVSTGTQADWLDACTATRTKSYDGLTPNIRQAIRDVGGSTAFAARNDFTEKDLRTRFLARVGELNSK